MSSYRNRTAFNALEEVIRTGMGYMDHDLTNERFKLWLDYSKKILEIIIPDNKLILLEYLRLIIKLEEKGIPPYQKLKICLEYLIEVMPRI